MGTLWQDLRYGIRMLAKNPGFTAVAVLTLALGIGANTAIFSVIDAVLLRPLPFAHQNRIVTLYERLPMFAGDLGFSAPDFTAFAQRQQAFQTLAAYRHKDVELSGDVAPERVTGGRASAALFPLLGVQPKLGRTFTAREDQPGHNVVILSYGLWQRRYGADRNIIGRSIALDRQPYTIIGVMPKHFQFPLPGTENNGEPAELWVPMAFSPFELQGWGNMYNDTVFGLLKPGVTLTQARENAGTTIAEVQKLYPAELLQRFPNAHVGVAVQMYHREITGDVRTPLLMLLLAVGVVLFIACANVANLLLARATGRQKEIAIRAALGAGRWRLVRQMLSESLLLGTIAGLAGLAVAHWGVGLLLALSPPDLPMAQGIGIDGQVFAFAFLLSALAAVAFGLIPGIEASRSDPQDALRESGRGTTPARARRKLQCALIVSQTALAVMLLIGAGLLLRSFARLLETNPGFRPQHVLTMTVSLPLTAYPHASDIQNFYRELLRRTAATPGAVAVGFSTDLPLDSQEHDAIEIEGRSPESGGNLPDVTQSWVMGNYLSAMGITLERGRAFTPEDIPGSPDVAIISESAARTFFPHEDPIGKRVKFTGPRWKTIVGVVNDVKDTSMDKAAAPHTYSPWLQVSKDMMERPEFGEIRTLNVAVRTPGNPANIASAVREQIAAMDPSLAVTGVETMDAQIRESLAPQRFDLFLLGLFAGLAILLAAVGVYGVLSYSVAQRTHEIGVRMALGAQAEGVMAMIIGEGMRLTLAGAALGLIAAFGMTRLMASLLYGVTAHDPVTFIAVVAMMFLVALLACYIPARRAMRVDPMIALRYE